MNHSFISYDAPEDVLCSIRHAIRVSQFLDDDPLAWKWVFLALHSALQGACVCHLSTTAEPIGAVTRRNAREQIEYFQKTRTDRHVEPPDTYLMHLPDLLKAVRRPLSAGGPSNEVHILISDTELRWLTHLHENIRNQFVHFEPLRWSIDVSGIPRFANMTARIIGQIESAEWGFRNLSPERRDAMRQCLDELTRIKWPV